MKDYCNEGGTTLYANVKISSLDPKQYHEHPRHKK